MAYRVFLSSTAADLDPWREAVFKEVGRVNRVKRVVWMKDWMAHPATSMKVCEEKVRTSDIFVGLIGHCFGSAPKERPERSYTMLEFDWAQDHGLPSLMHRAPEKEFDVDIGLIRRDGAVNQERQVAFREEIAGWHSGQPHSWKNADRLAADVAEAVRQQITRMVADTETGPTQARYEVSLLDRLQEITQAIPTAEPEAAAKLRDERQGVEDKLRNLEKAHADAVARIEEVEATLERYGNTLPDDLVHRVEAALEKPDFDEADRLLAQLTDHAEMEAEKGAAFYTRRGSIAEERIRWAEAAEHYARAASMSPNYDRLYKAREFAWRAGDYPSAFRHGEDLIKSAIREFGERTEQHAEALNEHATTLQDMGRYEEAERLYSQALEIDEATIGTGHPEYASHLNNLAGLLRAMGRYEEAEPLFRQAMEIDEATLGTGHPDYAIHLNNLAALLQNTGRYEEAEPLFRETLKIGEATFGTGHPDYASSLNNLAELLRAMGRYEEAEPLYRLAMEIDEATLGTSHPEYATNLNNLALLLQAMGRFEDAEPLYDQAIEILCDLLGPKHPNTKTVQANRDAFRAAWAAAKGE